MKIKINYELIQKIDVANKGFSLNQSVITNSKLCGKWFLFLCLMDGIFSQDHNLDVLNNFFTEVIAFSICGFMEMML